MGEKGKRPVLNSMSIGWDLHEWFHETLRQLRIRALQRGVQEPPAQAALLRALLKALQEQEKEKGEEEFLIWLEAHL